MNYIVLLEQALKKIDGCYMIKVNSSLLIVWIQICNLWGIL